MILHSITSLWLSWHPVPAPSEISSPENQLLERCAALEQLAQPPATKQLDQSANVAC